MLRFRRWMVRRYGICCLGSCNPPGPSSKTLGKCGLRPQKTTDRRARLERLRCSRVFQPPRGSYGPEHCPLCSWFADLRRRLGLPDKSSLDHIHWEARLYTGPWYQPPFSSFLTPPPGWAELRTSRRRLPRKTTASTSTLVVSCRKPPIHDANVKFHSLARSPR